jgi:hypothetical protein
MTFTYDLTTDRGKTRLYAMDTVSANAIFSDDEIDAFLSLNGSDIYLAAADALDIIASNQSYVLKVITNNGLSTNGPAVAADLRKGAQVLRDKSASFSTSSGISIVPNPDDPYLDLR